MAQQSAISLPSNKGLRPIGSLSVGSLAAQKFSREDGEVVWRDPRHRIVLPLTGAAARMVTVQLEGSRTREFVWRDGFGFYPANTHARVVTKASTAVQILWKPDAETPGKFEPLLPFEDPFIVAGANAIAGELDSGDADRLFVESIGRAIIAKLTRHFTGAAETARVSGMSRERLRRVMEYIDEHLGEELTLDVLADIACLSAHHLSRSFHRTMGVGLHRYVVQRRVDRAKQLVLESSLSMAEIAWMVGFGSQSAFTKRFHREVGQSPARLRRKG